MTFERVRSRSHGSSTPTVDDDLAPGRGSRSAQLAAPERPLVSALVQRKADANGVTADAETSIDRAGASTGQRLPDDVRERFEQSTGADLSSVRVHTGEPSAHA